MATDKQIEANRQNAQKSTGPKTNEGKTTSRANAMNHGLAGAGIVTPEEDRRSYEAKLAAYREEVGAEGELEEDLLSRVALAAVRVERCRRQEEARWVERRKKARAGWEAKKKKELDGLVAQLEQGPAAVVRRMMRMSVGCDWLITAWERLEEILGKAGCWEQDPLEFALMLNGRSPDWDLAGDTLANTLIGWNQTLQPGKGDQAGRARALAGLRAHIGEKIRDLEKLRGELQQGPEARELGQELDAVQVDTSVEGTRLLRYENSADHSLHRNLNRLIKIRLAEPEHLSVKRWLKMGKQCARIWNGTAWVPAPDTLGNSTTPGWGAPVEQGPAEAGLRNEANSAPEGHAGAELKAPCQAAETARGGVVQGPQEGVGAEATVLRVVSEALSPLPTPCAGPG